MNKSKLGLIWMVLLFAFFAMFPYYMWLHTTQELKEKMTEYNEIKNEIAYTQKLLHAVEDLTIKNRELAKSENEHISKYCTAINFSTKECKNFITQTSKAKVEKDKSVTEAAKKMLTTP